MAHNLRHNLVSAQYFENKKDRFRQIFIYAYILTRSRLGLLHVLFRKFVPELWHLIYDKFRFHSNS